MSARTIALDALKSLVEIIDKAGLSNLTNGVQLGQTSWYVKASARLEDARAAIADLEAEIAQEVEPVWFACDTEGAEFDVTFVATREEAAEAVDCALADNPDLKFEDLVTPLFTAPQAVNAELLEALEKIEAWSSHTATFSINFGSNGVRDLYRAIARAAIQKAEGAKP